MLITPDAVKLKKRQRKTETEVTELRIKLAQPAKSIVLSNREVRLLRYMIYTTSVLLVKISFQLANVTDILN